jgi:hypothetical protein
MMSTQDLQEPCVCSRCGTVVECCAFCEKEDCGVTICARCLRIHLGESLPHPHTHGG